MSCLVITRPSGVGSHKKILLGANTTKPNLTRGLAKPANNVIRLRADNNVIDINPIVIRYTKDYQINIMHEQIIKRLQHMADVPKLREKLNELILKPISGQTVIATKMRQKEIAKLKEEIRSYTSLEKLNNYISEASPIIEEYLSLGQYVEQISFDDDNELNLLSEDEIRRLIIIDSYFKVASRYVKIDVYRENVIKDNICENCNGKLISMSFDVVNGDQYCLNCNTISSAEGSLTYNESMKPQAEPRKYDVLITYKRELKQFQGTEKITLPEDLYSKLDDYFLSLDFETGEEVRKRPTDEYGKTEGTSLNGLCDALSEIGYSSLYKHANKIGKEYWGWKLHDLKKIMPLLINDFIVIQREFPYVEKQRSSNICSQHRILHQLLLRNVKVAITDFKLPGPEALFNSEIIWKRMVERTPYPYIPLFSVEDIESISNKNGFSIKLGQKVNVIEINETDDGDTTIVKSSKVLGDSY
jgi:hypothetical protein